MTFGREALIHLSDTYAECERCEILCNSRTQVVFGAGAAKASIMIIGTSPNSRGDAEGDPWEGESGELMLSMLAQAWPRTEMMARIAAIRNNEEYFAELRNYFAGHIFWDNAVMCYPPDDRPPSGTEVKECRSRLQKVIYGVDPVLIIAAGTTALTALVGKKMGVQNTRGNLVNVEIPSAATGNTVRYSVIPVYHPRYLIARGDQALVKRKKGDTYNTIEDLKWCIELVEAQFASQGRSFPEEEL